MNKTYNRSTDLKTLVVDLNLKASQALYLPFVESGQEPDTGDNDPSMLGAVATKVIDGKVSVLVYQGAGVWEQVQGGDGRPLLRLWDGEETNEGEYVTHMIDGVEYQFRSKEDGNTDEPTLQEPSAPIIPWIEQGGPLTAWDNEEPYALGAVVTNPYYAQNWAYKSLVAGNTGNDPFTEDINNPEFWEWLGYFEGVFDPDKYYTDTQVTNDVAGIAWKSTIYNNNYAFGETATSWRKSNAVPPTGIAEWLFPTAYLKGEYVTREVNESGTLYTYVYQAKQNNTGNGPIGGQYDTYWRFVGLYMGEYNPATTYGNYNVVFATIGEETNVYISNKANNTSPLIESVSKWEVIGAPAGGPGGVSPTYGAIAELSAPLIIDWNALISETVGVVMQPDDAGKTWLQKHGEFLKGVRPLLLMAADDVPGLKSFDEYWYWNQGTQTLIFNPGPLAAYWSVGNGTGGSSSSGGGGSITGAQIRAALGITTLSGNNTGDQDLTNLVAKVAGKSLILDTEIARLASVTNQDISGKENVGVAAGLIDTLKGGNITDTIATLRATLSELTNADSVISGQISDLMALLNSDNSALDTIQEIVDYIEQNRETIDEVLVDKLNKSVYDAYVTSNNLALSAKAPLASPAFTGVPTAPSTGLLGAKTDQVATMKNVTDAASTLRIFVTSEDYTFVLNDAGKLIESNSALVIFTIPANADVAFQVGTQIPIRQRGAGDTEIVAASGVTLQSPGGKTTLIGQYSMATLIKVDTDVWALDGGLK